MAVAPTPAHPERDRRFPSALLIPVLFFVLGCLAVLLLYRLDVLGGSGARSANHGSGVAASQTRDLAPFHAVELTGSNNVIIRVGGAQSVVVKGDDNLVDRITTEVQSGRLDIGTTLDSFSTKSPMSVEISVPSLDALTLSGAGNIAVTGVDAQGFTVDLPGSGTVTASGTTSRLDVTLGGSGTLQFSRLVANDVRAVLEGTGTIFVTATASIDASVSGVGSILYGGSPQHVSRNVSGTGSISASQ